MKKEKRAKCKNCKREVEVVFKGRYINRKVGKETEIWVCKECGGRVGKKL